MTNLQQLFEKQDAEFEKDFDDQLRLRGIIGVDKDFIESFVCKSRHFERFAILQEIEKIIEKIVKR